MRLSGAGGAAAPDHPGVGRGRPSVRILGGLPLDAPQLRRHAPVLRQMRSNLLEDLHRLEPVEVGFWLEAPRAPVGGRVAIGEFPAAQWPGAWGGLRS